MKRFLYYLLLTIAVAGVAVLGFVFFPTKTRAISQPDNLTDPALIEKGRYLAVAGDCVACHSPDPAKPFAGGYPFPSPIGAFYSTNITPDPASGIGRYSLDQFDRALRYGIRADGASLAPAMPYPSYARLTDQDVAALYAYFMHGVTPVQTDPVPNPSLRWLVTFWRKLFAPNPDKVAFDPNRCADATVARGAYLVQGAGHCGSCHTPRALTMQEKALNESGPAFLSGGVDLEGWIAINLRGNEAGGLGLWSAQDIVDSLKTGRNPHAAVVGPPMSLVTAHSMQYLSDEDLHAIAAYVKTLPASAGDQVGFAPSDATAKLLQAGVNDSRGAELYVDNCAGCHRSDAQGYSRVFPTLAGNPTVLSADPHSLVHLILAGSAMPVTQAMPSPLGMPGFAWRLSDEEVAQLATYVRTEWGNTAPPVGAETARKIRAQLSPAEQAAIAQAAHQTTRQP